MDSSTIFAPNSTLLSDKLIGGVVQRVAPLHGRLDNDCSFISPSRLPPAEYIENKIPISPTHTSLQGHKVKISASRRERCRINQARYRKRQRQHVEELDESICRLKKVQSLEIHKQNLLRNAPIDKSVWVVATEYFRQFCHGYMAPMNESPTARAQQQSQLDFLNATMAPDVTDGEIVGPDALLDNWKRFSFYHGDVTVALERLELLSENSLLATTRTSVTITQNALRCLYPHLVNLNSNSSGSGLALKLLNQRLVINGSVRFDWDQAGGRVARLESKVDLLSVMLRLLGDLKKRWLSYLTELR